MIIMEKYSKNLILSAEIDYYCVLCNEMFDHEADVEKHIRWEKHRKVLKLLEYYQKYKKDFIYKINDIYYCEVCNQITTNVAGHIQEDNHRAQKKNPQRISKKSPHVKRDGMIIKVNDKIVTKSQWHGIKDSKCSVCGVDILSTTYNNHIKSAMHMFNLLQSSIKCEAGNCYREVKYDRFYCFTCFETFENKFHTTHLTEEHSKGSSESINSTEINNNIKNSQSDANENIARFMIKILAKSHKKYFNVDVEMKTAKCLQCCAEVLPTPKLLDKHKSKCYSETEEIGFTITDSGKRRHVLAEYARKNYIKLNPGGSKCFCTLCDIFMSAHINCAKGHVEGSLHTGHLELKGLIKGGNHKKPPLKPVPYRSIYKAMHHTLSFAAIERSLLLVKIINGFEGRIGKCYACEVKLKCTELREHCKEREHKNKVLKCKVVPNKVENDIDLIREIHPDLYHCVCCNRLFPFWENMARHLRTFPHKIEKSKMGLLSNYTNQSGMSELCQKN